MLYSEIQSKIFRLDSLISKYEALSKSKKIGDSAVSFCSQSIQNALESIQIELRTIKEPNERQKFNEFLKLRNEKIQNIQNNWSSEEEIIQKHDNNYLNKKLTYQEEINNINKSDLLDIEKGDVIVQLTGDSIIRMKQAMIETEKLGDQSLLNMNSQKEQLNRIRGDLGDVNSNLSKAKLTIKAIARNTATDFCVQMLCGVLTISILIIIIICIILGVKKSNS